MKFLKVLFAIVLVAAIVVGALYWRRKHASPTPLSDEAAPEATATDGAGHGASRGPLLGGAGRLRIFALDVGQGDSLLIVTPAGKAVLVDGGRGDAANTVLAALKRAGVNSIDLAVATHPHSDHIVGLRQVIERVPVRALLDSGQKYASEEYERLLNAVKQRKVKFIPARRAMTFDLDSGVRLETENPQGDGNWITQVRAGGSVENANSVVMRLSYGGFAMIFTGDAEFETEALILKSALSLKAQVLKVGHHGSRYATSGRFLETVAPETAVISCGADNRYSHPAQSTLDRLKKAGIKVYRTDLSGEIAIETDGKTYQVQTNRTASLQSLWLGRLGLDDLAPPRAARAGVPRPRNEERD